MVLIVARSFPQSTDTGRAGSFPTLLGPSVQTVGVITVSAATHSDLSMTSYVASKLSPRSKLRAPPSSVKGGRLPTTASYPRFDSLIQVHLLGFESPWGGPLPPLPQGQPRPGVMEPTLPTYPQLPNYHLQQ